MIMQRPLKIVSRDFILSDPVEDEIRTKAEALDKYFDKISGCEVTLRAPAIKHHRKGGPFLVNIRLTVPGREIVVERQAEEELSQAIREAFDVARRQLEDYVRQLRGAVKTHEPGAVGRIIRINKEAGFGFIESADGREIYFHRNSLVNYNFDKLECGTSVRFTEESGDEGPQASSVIAIAGPSER
jgi:cold shock CspA family protein/ribosome-associated translation inhibitor RaiA